LGKSIKTPLSTIKSHEITAFFSKSNKIPTIVGYIQLNPSIHTLKPPSVRFIGVQQQFQVIVRIRQHAVAVEVRPHAEGVSVVDAVATEQLTHGIPIRGLEQTEVKKLA